MSLPRPSRPARVHVKAHTRPWPKPRLTSFNPFVADKVCRERVLAALYFYRLLWNNYRSCPK